TFLAVGMLKRPQQESAKPGSAQPSGSQPNVPPAVGDIGHVSSKDGGPVVAFADVFSLLEGDKALSAKDDIGLKKLVEEKRVFFCATGRPSACCKRAAHPRRAATWCFRTRPRFAFWTVSMPEKAVFVFNEFIFK